MAEQGFELLWRASALFSGACVLVLMLRPLLVRFGAWLAYASWLLVPLLLLASTLPPRSLVVVSKTVLAWRIGAESVVVAALPTQSNVPELLFGLWTFGVLVVIAVVARQHLRYVARLQWVAASGSWRAVDARGPALLGLFRPKLVLPNNFEAQFDEQEQAMILAHEEVHRQRGDNLWNAFAMALVALQWFNPLAYFAWRRMRADQELACDAAVMQRYPRRRPQYARALVKAQDASLAHSVACTWKSRHPLVERISMLAHNSPSKIATRTGNAILVITGLMAAAAVYAAQGIPPGSEADGTHFKLEMTVQLDGKQAASAKLVTGSGKPAAVKMANPVSDTDGVRNGWEVEITPKAMPDNKIELNAIISHGLPLQVIARPRMIVVDGTPAAIQVGTSDGAHFMRMDVVSTREVKAQ